MLIFTAEKKLGRGRYFPLTAIQRFDAAVSSVLSLIALFSHIFVIIIVVQMGEKRVFCACRMLINNF
uniref:Uncharacterized protein n=1 Tax=Salix viminalis TaxID=40686 RepID=A0A6N2KA71_SALVM